MNKIPRQKPKTAGYSQEMKSVPDFPFYCDYNCPHGSFPESDAVGACRREMAVYCMLYSKYNKKNGICLGRINVKRQPEDADIDGERGKR